jgi:hypothetical protein
MTRSIVRLSVAAALGLGLMATAACSDRDDDVVQAPAAGVAPEPVSEVRADTAMTSAAIGFGMTRDQLEDADLISSTRTDLGDVETLVLDAAGTLTHVVVDLEGPGGDVAIPVADLRSLAQDNGAMVDLTTDLTAAQLSALPAWTPETPAAR